MPASAYFITSVLGAYFGPGSGGPGITFARVGTNLPADEDEFLIAIFVWHTTVTGPFTITVQTVPTDWTLLESASVGNISMATYWKRAGVSEPDTSYDWTYNAEANTLGFDTGGVILRYTPDVTGSPLDSDIATYASDATPDAPSVTNSAGRAILICGWGSDPTSATGTIAAPGDMTERGGGNISSDMLITAADLEVASGATGAKTGTDPNAASASIGFSTVVEIPRVLTFVPPLQVGHHGTHNPPGIAGPPLRAGPAAGGQFSPQVQRGHRY